MLPHLGVTLEQARKSAGLSRESIASAAGCSFYKVRNLEKAKAWPRSPGDADELVSAYAKLTHSTAIDLWASALQRWRDDEDPVRQFEAQGDPERPPSDGQSSSDAADPPGEDAGGEAR
jgi:transcriptional regulator with XRE-family HTH domain